MKKNIVFKVSISIVLGAYSIYTCWCLTNIRRTCRVTTHGYSSSTAFYHYNGLDVLQSY